MKTQVISLRVSDTLYQQYKSLPSVYRRALLEEMRGMAEKLLSASLSQLTEAADTDGKSPLEKAKAAVDVISHAASGAMTAKNTAVTVVSEDAEQTMSPATSQKTVQAVKDGDSLTDGCEKIHESF